LAPEPMREHGARNSGSDNDRIEASRVQPFPAGDSDVREVKPKGPAGAQVALSGDEGAGHGRRRTRRPPKSSVKHASPEQSRVAFDARRDAVRPIKRSGSVGGAANEIARARGGDRRRRRRRLDPLSPGKKRLV